MFRNNIQNVPFFEYIFKNIQEMTKEYPEFLNEFYFLKQNIGNLKDPIFFTQFFENSTKIKDQS